MVRARQIDPDNHAVWSSVEGAGNRAEALGQHRARTAMQETKRLGIALDRHRRHYPARHSFGDNNVHPHGKCTAAAADHLAD